MDDTRTATEVFNRDFLEIRCRLLDLAAALDRLDRAPGRVDPHDRRLGQIRHALESLQFPEPDRAATIQIIFSDDYDPHWRESATVEGRV